MTADQKAELEKIGDRLEEIARSLPAWSRKDKLEAEFYDVKDLFSAAWDIKQAARRADMVKKDGV